jgi:hypothetical protein
LNFFAGFPSQETQKLLLEWHALYSSLQAEKKNMSGISHDEAQRMLNIPARKINQYIREGYLKQKPSGELFKYQVIGLLFEMKQQELFASIR